MNKKEFNEALQTYFDDMNSVGLGELLLLTDGIIEFVENTTRRELQLKDVVDICGGYLVNARTFVTLISYDNFKQRRGISEIMAIGLRLYLLYQCGVDWTNPKKQLKGL